MFNDNDDDESDTDEHQHIVRPPPLMILSQTIRSKHPEQLNDTTLNDRYLLTTDLPSSPANYSFVFYNLTASFVLRE